MAELFQQDCEDCPMALDTHEPRADDQHLVTPMEIARHPSFTVHEKLELLDLLRTSESGPEASQYYDDDHLARIAEAIALVKAEVEQGTGLDAAIEEDRND